MKIVIVYHSGYGHTKVVAEQIAIGAKAIVPEVQLLTTQDASSNPGALQDADTIVFGTPTYFGNVSAEFKKFMESTTSIWTRQLWKDKLAAGFTNSSSRNGDKLHTLSSLSLFAAQHGMLWISMGILPQYDTAGWQLTHTNEMASYLGLMTMSANSSVAEALPSDLYTAEMFGRRLGEVTRKWRWESQLLATAELNNGKV